MKNVAIVGGGIIGNFIAYYLSSRDINVTIVDDHPSMLPASHGNCGLITPSHIMPMNRWGYIWKGLKWLGNKQAPLRIKPQLDLNFLSWFMLFMLYSNTASRHKALNKRHGLLTKSRKLLEDFLKNEKPDCNWKSEGVLYVCSSKAGLQELESELALLDKFDLSGKMLSKEALFQLEPSLADQVIGGAIYNVDGWLNPSELISSLKQINAGQGVGYIQGQVSGFKTFKGKIEHMETSNGAIEADNIVIANGAQSPLLASKLGIYLSIIPGKGYNITYNRQLKNQPKRPVYMIEKKVVATPWSSGFRLGSTMEFTGYDLALDDRRLSALKEASNEYLKTEIGSEEHSSWAGWRPMSSNELPVIRPSKKYNNLIFATGHGMLGLSMAPVTGHIVSEMLQ